MKHSGLRWLWAAVLVIVVDQVVKWLMVVNLSPYEPHHVLPVLDITLMYNTGAAFNFLASAGGWQRWAFIVLSSLVSLGIIWWLTTLHAVRHRLLAFALSLILGGAIGNAIDRVRLGRVVDFIYPHWNDHWFAAFNVADSAITVGAILLLFDALLESATSKKSPVISKGAGKGAST